MNTKRVAARRQGVLRWLLLLLVVSLVLVTVSSQASPERSTPAAQSPGVTVPRATADTPRQQTQAERDRMVVRLRITPAHVTARIGERLQFAAIAEDGEGRPVGGVALSWRAERVNAGSDLAITDDGQVIANASGRYRVVAEGAGQRTEATVELVPAGGLGPAVPGHLTSGVADAQVVPAAAPASGGHPGLLPPHDRIWDKDSLPAAEDPINRRGANPLDKLTPAGSAEVGGVVDNSGAGSGNARFTLPLLNLPGRGIHLGLALTYTSQLWNRVADEMVFAPELDDDWPAPGWTLGFGKVVGSVLIDADGDRHVLGDPRVPVRDEQTRYSTDGSFIECKYRRYAEVWRQDVHCHYPDGSVIEFDHFTASDVNYPTRIADADGNQVTIQYRSYSDPAIDSIYDTLGRKITFHYQESGPLADRGRLTAITAPGLNGGVRTLARFMWGTKRLTPSFGGGLKIWPNERPDILALLAMYYPDTGAGYWFRDVDSYSSYGMVASLSEQRNMYFSGVALTEQGVIRNGRTVHKVSYNYPNPDPTLTKPPTYTQATEVWEGMTTAPAVTEYHRLGELVREIKHPDGRRQVHVEVDGKPLRVETFTSTGALLSRQVMLWETGEWPYASGPCDWCSPRLKRVKTTDQHGQVAMVRYTYGPFDQVTDVREYDYDQTTVRRRTHIEYESAPGYRTRHIFGLASVVETYDGETGVPVTRTQIKHDGQAMSPTPDIVQHDPAFNPEKPQYAPETRFRGHVTRVTRYARAADRSEPVTQRFRYDRAGNLVSVKSGCCEWGAISYTSATHYAYPEQSVRGAADPSSPDRVVLHSSYDFNTGTPLSATDADGLTTLLVSDPETLRPVQMRYPGGAITTFAYDDERLWVSATTRPVASANEVQVSMTWLNGRGLPIRQALLAPVGSDVSWDVTEARYDQLGRPTHRSNPVRRTGEASTWAAPEHWHLIGRDGAGRVASMRSPDGSTSLTLYGEVERPRGASMSPGGRRAPLMRGTVGVGPGPTC